jgi:HEAT repeat protein
MLRKISIVLLAFTLLFSLEARASEMSSSKIKRLINQLYDKASAMDAQRLLEGYAKDAVPYLLPLLNDSEHESVRVAALYLLGKAGDSSVEDQVIERLADPNHRVRKEAAAALAILGTARSVDKLKELMTDADPAVRYNALKALARIAPKDETAIFVTSLGDYDARVRKFAVVGLGDINAKDTIASVSLLVQDMDPEVRMEVARTLGKFATTECLNPLSAMLNDGEQNIRLLVVESISKISGPESDDVLVKAADNQNAKVASQAIKMLSDKKSAKALVTAKKHLNSEYMDVKIASIAAIGDSGVPSDKSLIEPLLSAESTLVRKEAQNSLDKLGKSSDGK